MGGYSREGSVVCAFFTVFVGRFCLRGYYFKGVGVLDIFFWERDRVRIDGRKVFF